MKQTSLTPKYSYLNILKGLILSLILLIPFLLEAGPGKQVPSSGTAKWTASAFDQKVFIENKGQFDAIRPFTEAHSVSVNDHVQYGIRLQGLEMYFTPSGVTWRHRARKMLDKQELEERAREKGKDINANGEEEEENTILGIDSVSMQWMGSNPNVSIVAEKKVSNYFTYPDPKNTTSSTIIANAFEKITYKNLYPGIDVEYTFPANKPGIKYTLIVHPGADVSAIRMKYFGNPSLSTDPSGNALIQTDMGTFTDHAPVSQYDGGGSIQSSFDIHHNEVRFLLNPTYDHSKTVIIDPWTIVPTFISINNGTDIDCDNLGNIYVYGGTVPFQEIMLNPAGVIQWTYTTAFASANTYYGDFAVDPHSQVSYITDGFNTSGTQVAKVSPAGAQLAMLPQNPNMVEMWRIIYNKCTHTFVVAGGGTSFPYQGCVLDTTLTTVTPVNILGCPGPFHDFGLLAQDDNANAYMATDRSVQDPTNFDNIIVKVPIPSLLPITYSVSDGYTFIEAGSATYFPASWGSYPNGFNGMAVNSNSLYTYDGSVLKRWNPATGALINSITVCASPYLTGGLVVDACDHVFVGAGSVINQYDVNLNLVGTIPTTSTVYDLKFGPNNLLYVTGTSYVSSIQLNLTPCSSLNLTVTNTNLCNPTNSATVTVNSGTAPYTYSWSTTPVQTTATATGLSPGWYYVNVIDASCNRLSAVDSVHITSAAAPVVTVGPNATTCAGKGVPLTSGGATTYSWSPATGLSSVTAQNPTASPLVTTTYTVTGANGACTNTATVTITVTPGPAITISAIKPPTCFAGTNGSALAGATGGILPYTYAWSNGSAIDSVKNLAAGTYFLTVKDSAGCTGKDSVIITQPSKVTVTPMPSTRICISQCSPLTATGAGGTPGYIYSWVQGVTPVTPPVCPAATSIYTVVVTDANGCFSNPATVTLSLNPPIEASVTPDTSMCPGSSAMLHASATGGNNLYSYTWTPAAGLSSTTISNPVATPAAPTTYTVIVTDACGTPSDSSIMSITIYTPPVISFSAPDTVGCATLCVTFTSTSVPACSSIVWNFGDGTTGTGCAGITHCYKTAGTFSVKDSTTDIHGCKNVVTKTNYVTTYPKPKAAFSASPQPTTIINPNISFTDLSTNANSWSWTFGDVGGNDSSSLQNPHYTYPDTGCYTAYLLVKNNFGCRDSITHPVCIKPDFTFYAPNAFTPNGDALNDIWMPYGTGIDPAHYHLMIFDRWGNLLFETMQWGQGWDGKANNGAAVAQQDTYVWKVDVKDENHQQHKFIGNCNLIK